MHSQFQKFPSFLRSDRDEKEKKKDTPALIRLLAVLLVLRLWKAGVIWVHLGGKGRYSFSECSAEELSN